MSPGLAFPSSPGSSPGMTTERVAVEDYPGTSVPEERLQAVDLALEVPHERLHLGEAVALLSRRGQD